MVRPKMRYLPDLNTIPIADIKLLRDARIDDLEQLQQLRDKLTTVIHDIGVAMSPIRLDISLLEFKILERREAAANWKPVESGGGE